jgi:hypothetical protein
MCGTKLMLRKNIWGSSLQTKLEINLSCTSFLRSRLIWAIITLEVQRLCNTKSRVCTFNTMRLGHNCLMKILSCSPVATIGCYRYQPREERTMTNLARIVFPNFQIYFNVLTVEIVRLFVLFLPTGERCGQRGEISCF